MNKKGHIQFNYYTKEELNILIEIAELSENEFNKLSYNQRLNNSKNYTKEVLDKRFDSVLKRLRKDESKGRIRITNIDINSHFKRIDYIIA